MRFSSLCLCFLGQRRVICLLRHPSMFPLGEKLSVEEVALPPRQSVVSQRTFLVFSLMQYCMSVPLFLDSYARLDYLLLFGPALSGRAALLRAEWPPFAMRQPSHFATEDSPCPASSFLFLSFCFLGAPLLFSFIVAFLFGGSSSSWHTGGSTQE